MDLTNAAGSPNELESRLFEAIVNGTHASNLLPDESDELSYCESLPGFQEKVHDFRQRIVNLIIELATNVDSDDSVFDLAFLRDYDPTQPEAFKRMADVIELMFENVDACLNEAKSGVSGNDNSLFSMSQSQLVRDVRLGLNNITTHADIERPQDKFEALAAVDNSTQPFKPKITCKPNALVPLCSSKVSSSSAINNGTLSVVGSTALFENPYKTEIEYALTVYPTWLGKNARQYETIRGIDEVSCTWVDTAELLQSMISSLKCHKAIAVDLENHSYRSYQGFCCLLQISVPDEDWLVDAIALRGELECLNEIFTDPSILKVLHGADLDIMWLQRDFGVYVVSLFDTGRASRCLSYPSAGLAHALFRHAKVRVNKAFQLADWRMRPLPEDMIKYAREDTRYLLNVFDCMRIELLHNHGESGLIEVLRSSADIALKVYKKPESGLACCKKLIENQSLRLSEVQNRVLEALCTWRDKIARREDESTGYVLPNRMLVKIASCIPSTALELKECCGRFSPIVQARVTELLALLHSASKSLQTDDDDEELEAINANKAHHSPDSSSSEANCVEIPSVAQIGFNASQASFIPLKRLALAANIQKRPDSNRKPKDGRENSSRVTPSPVLTTDQLYDAAGWRDIADSGWKANIAAKVNGESEKVKADLNVWSEGKSVWGRSKSDNHQRAMETMTKIGEEQLGGTFGILSGGCVSNIGNVINVDMEDEIDVEAPADADALESDDLPRSIAEIYRISSRNRKRNRNRKKRSDTLDQKVDIVTNAVETSASVAKGSSNREMESNVVADGTRGKGGSSFAQNEGSGTEDAIAFMRNLGWVKAGIDPVPSVSIEGVHVETHGRKGSAGGESAGNTTSGNRFGGGRERGLGSGGRGSESSRGSGKKNSSPRTRPATLPPFRSASSGRGQANSFQQQKYSYAHSNAKNLSSFGGNVWDSKGGAVSDRKIDGTDASAVRQSRAQSHQSYRKGNTNVNSAFFANG